jgi:26S proteasome regulatory subunit N10
VTAAPGPHVLLSDVLISSPILAGDRSAGIPDDLVPGGAGDASGSGSGGASNSAAFEFGVDPSLDPELAMVRLRLPPCVLH